MSNSNAILTVRVIKSFAYRTEKNVILRGLNLDQLTVRGLKDTVGQGKESSHRSMPDECKPTFCSGQD
jgi:hypothetical protein